MNYIELKHSNIRISKLGLGSWAIGGGTYWGENNDAESVKTIHTALEQGINVVDTAPVYNFGHSEEVVGKAIRDRRDKVILATKCGLNWDENRGGYRHSQDRGHQVYRNLTPASIRKDVQDSLRRIGTDYIDICITHWPAVPEFPTPIEETMGELMKMKQEGLIRAIGASNVNEQIVEEYLKYGQLDIIQERYSMLDRKNERLFRFCQDRDISIMAYSPLEQGLLAGKYKRDFKNESGGGRMGKPWYQPENLAKLWDMMDRWKPLYEKYDCTMSQLVIAWTAAQATNLQVLCGCRKPEQILDDVRGGEITLCEEDIKFMTSLAEETAATP